MCGHNGDPSWSSCCLANALSDTIMRERRRHRVYVVCFTTLCVVGQASAFLSAGGPGGRLGSVGTATATAAAPGKLVGERRCPGVELSCASATEQPSVTARCARNRVGVCNICLLKTCVDYYLLVCMRTLARSNAVANPASGVDCGLPFHVSRKEGRCVHMYICVLEWV